jgi:hypothetical protein
MTEKLPGMRGKDAAGTSLYLGVPEMSADKVGIMAELEGDDLMHVWSFCRIVVGVWKRKEQNAKLQKEKEKKLQRHGERTKVTLLLPFVHETLAHSPCLFAQPSIDTPDSQTTDNATLLLLMTAQDMEPNTPIAYGLTGNNDNTSNTIMTSQESVRAVATELSREFSIESLSAPAVRHFGPRYPSQMMTLVCRNCVIADGLPG